MNRKDLARIKIDRAIKISEPYEALNENSLRNIFNCLINALKLIPKDDIEKEELLAHLENMHSQEYKLCGGVFVAETEKLPIRIDKFLLKELIWRAHSLLF